MSIRSIILLTSIFFGLTFFSCDNPAKKPQIEMAHKGGGSDDGGNSPDDTSVKEVEYKKSLEDFGEKLKTEFASNGYDQLTLEFDGNGIRVLAHDDSGESREINRYLKKPLLNDSDILSKSFNRLVKMSKLYGSGNEKGDIDYNFNDGLQNKLKNSDVFDGTSDKPAKLAKSSMLLTKAMDDSDRSQKASKKQATQNYNSDVSFIAKKLSQMGKTAVSMDHNGDRQYTVYTTDGDVYQLDYSDN